MITDLLRKRPGAGAGGAALDCRSCTSLRARGSPLDRDGLFASRQGGEPFEAFAGGPTISQDQLFLAVALLTRKIRAPKDRSSNRIRATVSVCDIVKSD